MNDQRTPNRHPRHKFPYRIGLRAPSLAKVNSLSLQTTGNSQTKAMSSPIATATGADSAAMGQDEEDTTKFMGEEIQ